MGANYYIENDGTIHSKPVSNEGAITESPAVSRAYGDPSYNPAEHQISKLRVGAFWTISIIFSVLLGIGSYLLIGELLFGTAEEASSFWASVWAWVGPYALIVSSVSGCALYGACCAEERSHACEYGCSRSASFGRSFYLDSEDLMGVPQNLFWHTLYCGIAVTITALLFVGG